MCLFASLFFTTHPPWASSRACSNPSKVLAGAAGAALLWPASPALQVWKFWNLQKILILYITLVKADFAVRSESQIEFSLRSNRSQKRLRQAHVRFCRIMLGLTFWGQRWWGAKKPQRTVNVDQAGSLAQALSDLPKKRAFSCFF